MMKSYQLSVVSCQRKSYQSPVASRQLKNGLKNWKLETILFFFLFLCSCGDEGLVDPHGETTLPAPEATGFTAIDLPTAPGSAWTYLNVDTHQEFTLRVGGSRDISGTTHRQLTISELTTDEPDPFTLEAVDHLVANAYYLRIETEFYDGFAFPIFATYFSKTSQTLVESAFDIYLPDRENPGFLRISHYKHFSAAPSLGFSVGSRERVGSF